MNQKEYELIAGELKELKSFVDKKNPDLHQNYANGKYDAWYILVNNMTNTLARTYSNFDRNKFLKACGL